MTKDILNFAKDKQYTKFSDAIKQELHRKLHNSDEIKNYSSEFDKLQNMKDLFNQISTSDNRS